MNPSNLPDHVDIVIVGAGISGIGAAAHLRTELPDRSFVILDAMEDFGGTWLTHRYPGVRSDSDLYTFGYRFKPWTGPPIATAEQIRTYLGEVIDEHDLDARMHYGHRVRRANWSSEHQRWTLDITRTDTGETRRISCSFLWMCQGYYRHEQGHTPNWSGMERFSGQIVHPQQWPEDLNLSGKRVIVIGSGATAATLVPAIAPSCEHVYLLQRSPTYFWSARNANELADTLRELEISETWIHEIVRRKILHDQRAIVELCVEAPELVTEQLLATVREYLGEDYDIETHFTPRYRPWQQRIAFVPDGDLFVGIRDGLVTMVTDEIEEFTPDGIRTAGGQELHADVIITATGFELSVLGDIEFVVDADPVDFAETVTYRGMMFTGIPNMVWVFGYFRASWTLRADLVSEFVCRLLRHMDERGARSVVPRLRAQDESMPLLPWVDEADFNPNYLLRGAHLLPRRGDRPEWQHSQDYWLEKDLLPAADLDDGCLRYE